MDRAVRKPNRLTGYDYREYGSYFVTICAYNMESIFGEICRDSPCGCPQKYENSPVMEYSDLGKIAVECMESMCNYKELKVVKYIVMPNHIHAIIDIEYNGLADNAVYVADSRKGCPYTQIVSSTSLSDFVGRYKSIVANRWLKQCKDNNIFMGQIWQRSFHDHIIRNEKDFQRIWDYIENNPINWENDCFYPYPPNALKTFQGDTE
ncbi:MAG: transposase [Oscillospiraceae bacterium]|nr:transposase [Oscillospiraceae bacterium]